MKKTLISLVAILGVIGMLIVVSCGSPDASRSYSQDDSLNELDDSLLNLKMNESLEIIISSMPMPTEIIKAVIGSGAEYNPDILLASDHYKQFAGRNMNAMGLGAYGAQLNYALKQDKIQESMQLLKSSKMIADDIGVMSAFGGDVVARYEANINNRAELDKIASETFDKVKQELKANDQFDIATLIIFGSWMEGLYFATSSFKDNPAGANAELRKSIAAQRAQLGQVLQFMANFEDDTFVSDKMLGNYLKLIELKKIDNFLYNLSDSTTISDEEYVEFAGLIGNIRNRSLMVKVEEEVVVADSTEVPEETKTEEETAE